MVKHRESRFKTGVWTEFKGWEREVEGRGINEEEEEDGGLKEKENIPVNSKQQQDTLVQKDVY